MELATAPKHWQKTEIGGNAVVQQGDRQVVNTLNIATAYIAVQDALDLNIVELKTGVKRCLNDPDNIEAAPRKRQKIEVLYDGDDGEGTRNGVFVSEGNDTAWAQMGATPTTTQIVNAAATSSDVVGYSPGQRDHLFQNLQRLYQNALAPFIPRAIAIHLPQIFRRCPSPVEAGQQYGEQQLVLQSPAQPLQELAFLCIAMVSFLAYRNVSGKELSKVYTRCQQDKLLPLMSMLLGIGITRYLCFSVPRAVSELSSCIILEDAFRIEKAVPLSACESFSSLTSFLESYYRGTTGEAFVQAGQFNLTLGSRRGVALREHDWSIKGRVKPEHRVVMAVYLKKGDAKCTHCNDELIVSENGEFYCVPCDRYFRDCDALKYFMEIIGQPAPQTKVRNQASRTEAAGRWQRFPLPRFVEVDDEEDDNYAVEGLKNIDIRIIPRRKQQKAATSARRQSLIERLKRMPFIFLCFGDSHKAENTTRAALAVILIGHRYRDIQVSPAGYFVLFEASPAGQLEADCAFKEAGPKIRDSLQARLQLHRAFSDVKSEPPNRTTSILDATSPAASTPEFTTGLPQLNTTQEEFEPQLENDGSVPTLPLLGSQQSSQTIAQPEDALQTIIAEAQQDHDKNANREVGLTDFDRYLELLQAIVYETDSKVVAPSGADCPLPSKARRDSWSGVNVGDPLLPLGSAELNADSSEPFECPRCGTKFVEKAARDHHSYSGICEGMPKFPAYLQQVFSPRFSRDESSAIPPSLSPASGSKHQGTLCSLQHTVQEADNAPTNAQAVFGEPPISDRNIDRMGIARSLANAWKELEELVQATLSLGTIDQDCHLPNIGNIEKITRNRPTG